MEFIADDAAQRELVSFFKQAARKDQDVLEKLELDLNFSIEPDRWCFSLPDLHAFLQRQNTIFAHTGYSQFRKLVFCSLLNQVMRSCGAEIIIVDNQGHVDRSGYALVWNVPEPG